MVGICTLLNAQKLEKKLHTNIIMIISGKIWICLLSSLMMDHIPPLTPSLK